MDDFSSDDDLLDLAGRALAGGGAGAAHASTGVGALGASASYGSLDGAGGKADGSGDEAASASVELDWGEVEHALNLVPPAYLVPPDEFDSMPRVVEVLSSLQPRKALAELQGLEEGVERLVDTVVRAHHNDFNRAIQNYSSILQLFNEGQGRAQALRGALGDAGKLLSAGSASLQSQWVRIATLRKTLKHLHVVEAIAGAPAAVADAAARGNWREAMERLKAARRQAAEEPFASVAGLAQTNEELDDLAKALPEQIVGDLVPLLLSDRAASDLIQRQGSGAAASTSESRAEAARLDWQAEATHLLESLLYVSPERGLPLLVERLRDSIARLAMATAKEAMRGLGSVANPKQRPRAARNVSASRPSNAPLRGPARRATSVEGLRVATASEALLGRLVEHLSTTAKRCSVLDDVLRDAEARHLDDPATRCSLERVLWEGGIAELLAIVSALLKPPDTILTGSLAPPDSANEASAANSAYSKSSWFSGPRSAAVVAADEAASALVFDLGFSKAMSGSAGNASGAASVSNAGVAPAPTRAARRGNGAGGGGGGAPRLRSRQDYSFLSSLESAGVFLTPGVHATLLPLVAKVENESTGAAEGGADTKAANGEASDGEAQGRAGQGGRKEPLAELRSFLSQCVQNHLLPSIGLGYETHIQEAVSSADAYRPLSGHEVEPRAAESPSSVSPGMASLMADAGIVGTGEAAAATDEKGAQSEERVTVLAAMAASMRQPPHPVDVPVPVLRSAAAAMHELEALSTSVPGYTAEVLGVACGMMRVLLAECRETLDHECGSARARALIEDRTVKRDLEAEQVASIMPQVMAPRSLSKTANTSNGGGGSVLCPALDAAPCEGLVQRILSEAPVPMSELLSDSEAATLLACMSTGLLSLALRADELERAAARATEGLPEDDPTTSVPAALAAVAADCRKLARHCLQVLRLEALIVCSNARASMVDADPVASPEGSSAGIGEEGSLEVEEGVLAVVRQIAQAHRAVSKHVAADARAYVFGGCTSVAAAAMMSSLTNVNVVDASSARRACRGCTALQQAVSSIDTPQADGAVLFGRARSYFSLLLLDPEDVLSRARAAPDTYTPAEWAALLAVYVSDRQPVSYEQREELKAIVAVANADAEAGSIEHS